MDKRILKCLAYAVGTAGVLTLGLSWQRYDRINLDSFAKSGHWEYRIYWIPFWVGRDDEISRGFSREYQGIFGHPASAASERSRRVGGINRPFETVIRCGSSGFPYSERRTLVEGLCQRYREGLIDPAAAREIFFRIDAAVPLTQEWVDFVDHRFEQSAPLTEAIRRDLGMPSRFAL